MKRRQIGAGLLIAALLTMAGCGAKDVTVPQTDASENAVQEDATEAETEDLSTDEDTETRNEATEAEPTSETDDVISEDISDGKVRPQLMSTSEYFYEWDYEDENATTPIFDGYGTILRLTPDSAVIYPALDEAISTYSNNLVEDLRSIVPIYITDSKELRASSETMKDVTYEEKRDIYVRRADEQVLSILSTTTGFQGGAHGYTAYESKNYDTATGEELTLTDIVTDTESFASSLSMRLIERYGEALFEGFEETVQSMVAGDMAAPLVFCLDSDGVTFLFNQYDIAPYASGVLTIWIPYSDGLINDTYAPKEENGYVTEFALYQDFYTDLGNDGVEDWIALYEENDEYGYISSLTIMVNGENYTVEELYVYSASPYLIQTADGRDYLYVKCSSDNDYVFLNVYDLTGGNVREVGSFGGAGASLFEEDDHYFYTVLTDPDAMLLYKHLELLSTYNASKLFFVGADGMPESDAALFEIGWIFTLKSVADIDCLLVEDGEVAETVTVPAGSEFTLKETDGEHFVDADVEGIGRVRLVLGTDEERWGHTINGVSEWDLFEMLYYAG